MKNEIRDIFITFVKENDFQIVERSNLVSKYFKNEFNLSGGHSHLIPAILSSEKVNKENIAVIDLCIRKVDTEIIGISKMHLLLFEMGVWGGFGYIEDKKQEEFRQLSLLLNFLNKCGIGKDSLYFTICAGGQYLDKQILPDDDSYDILSSLGITSNRIVKTNGRINFMLSRGIDRLAGYNIEIFVKKDDKFVEIASSNIYQYLNKLTHLEKTVNTGIGCGIGIERIEFIVKGYNNIYDLDFFQTIKEKIRKALDISEFSISIISNKIYRSIELSKTLVFLINDNQGFDKSAQGKAMKSYLAKIKSELEFLSIPIDIFMKTLKSEIAKIYADYHIKNDAFDILFSELNRKAELL
jgi:alanyl-tRNA synthetase